MGQKQDDPNLRYDFRLSVVNVLVPWAVPKGYSFNPKDKRLAMLTDSHPLEYADFEGVIPKDEYSATTVQVLDASIYCNLKESTKIIHNFASIVVVCISFIIVLLWLKWGM